MNDFFFFTKICIQSTLIKPSSRLVYNPTNVILKVSSRACIREYTCVSNPSLRSFISFYFVLAYLEKAAPPAATSTRWWRPCNFPLPLLVIYDPVVVALRITREFTLISFVLLNVNAVGWR